MDKFSDLQGKILRRITIEDNRVFFETSNELIYLMSHKQQCCEDVYIDDICGKPRDILNLPILLAEEVSNHDNPKEHDYDTDTHTWTFYKLVTMEGSLTIRWYGVSSGNYSEIVEFERIQ